MPLNRSQWPDAALERQRAALRRDMRRATTAAVVILVVLAGLALAAVLAASLSDQNARQAVAASEYAESERMAAGEALWKASLAQARAERVGNPMGHRQRGLEALAAAARIRSSLELRNEAIAALSSVDVAEEGWRAHPPEVSALAFDGNLERYAMADSARGLSVRSAASHEELQRLGAGLRQAVQSLRFSAEGRRLAASCLGGDLVVWDLAQGALLLVTNLGQAYPATVDLTSDGSHVAAAGGGNQVVVFELATGREVFRLKGRAPLGLASFHPSAAVLAVAVGTEVQVWDWRTNELLTALPHADRVMAVAWRQDGRFIASGCHKGNVCLWDVARRQAVVMPGHTDVVTRTAFSHRGDLLVSTAYDGTTRFWDALTGRFLFNTHRGYAMEFSLDDSRIAFGRPKEGAGVWRVLQSTGYRAIPVGGDTEKNVWTADFSSDARQLAVTQADGVRLLDLPAGTLAQFAPMDQAKSGWFTPDGSNVVASGAAGVRIWPVEPCQTNGRLTLRLGAPRDMGFSNKPPFQRCELSPDGRSVLAAAGSRAAVLLGLDGRAVPVWFEDPRYVNLGSAVVSPDGQWVGTGTFHGSGTRVWDARTGKAARDLGGRSASVAFSPDGRWLVAAASDEYRFWRAGSWEAGPAIARDALGELTGYVAFTRDGRKMAIAKSHRLVQLIDPATQRELASLTPPDPHMINGLRFDAGGRQLAVATPQGIVQVWNLPALQQELAKLGLDWDPKPQSEAPGALGPGAPRVVAGAYSPFAAATALFIWLAAAGIGVAAVAALLVFKRWHNLSVSYERIEALAAQRNVELDRAQAGLLLSQKMKALGTLAAGIAHDFNNLLSIIRMSNQLIQRATRGRPEVEEEVESIERAVRQGKTVVQSMLGYTRDSAGTVGDFQVAEVVDDAMPMFTRQFLSGIVLTLEMAPGLPMVRGSRDRLQQILLNLIVNAAEAMQGEGTLGLRLRACPPGEGPFVLRPQPAAAYVELSVSDSGPGIPPEQLPRIFEPFFTTKVAGATRGTGLGLSMVYSLAEHDGLGIRVRTAPGQGTTFSLVLPVNGAGS